MIDRLLTPKAAAALLAISTRQLRDLTIDGQIPFVDVGRGTKRPSRRYDPADIEAFKAARKTRAAPRIASVSGLCRRPFGVGGHDLETIRRKLVKGEPLVGNRNWRPPA